MDPTTNLSRQRELYRRITQRITEGYYRDHPAELTHDADQLAELSQALDDWLSTGGSLPEQWVKHWKRSAIRPATRTTEPPV
jgi:hypothetical protein